MATAAVILLIIGLGVIANKLHEIDDQLAYAALGGAAEGSSLPAEVAAKGRAVYVPAYSQLYSDDGRAVPLSINLSVRNTDPEHPIRIDQVRLHDDHGDGMDELVDETRVLAPMATASYLIQGRDLSNGSGANFVVEWSAQEQINRPIIEAIMLGPDGVAFKSRGEPIERR
ncbi:DUF3124 domain-containing protein [Thiohalocapsa marina]|nr:DUF3124 domain-containing protein [Thiohalocapsa marina]